MQWSERQYLIALNMVPGIGGRRLMAMQDHFGSLDRAWHAPRQALANVPGIGPKIAKKFSALRSSISPDKEELWANSLKAEIITTCDKTYPAYLGRLAVPPPVLYVIGTLPHEPGIAVVGTRRPSKIGIAQAKQFSTYIVRQGKTVVSGFARGIDFFAHDQAIQLEGQTVAVLGSNIGKIYPSEHVPMVQRITESGGAVISEFSSRCPTVPGNFPRRNRIIAGCASGVLVVQAGAKSGALRTADWALELGLEVWAIPGEISDPLRQGTHNLIKQGAQLVNGPSDLLANEVEQKPASLSVGELYQAGRNANEIAALLKQPIHEVLSEISLLQVSSGGS